jgi:hypothetical protein
MGERMVSDQVQKLKAALGDHRFRVVDEYVQSGSFFPPVPARN